LQCGENKQRLELDDLAPIHTLAPCQQQQAAKRYLTVARGCLQWRH